MIIIRVRSRDGLERVEFENSNVTVSELKRAIETQLKIPVANQTLSKDQKLLLASSEKDKRKAFKDMANPLTWLSSLDIGHGHIIFLDYEGERSVTGPRVKVSTAGSRKMTMTDLIARQVRIERQEKPHCASVSFDRDAANNFQRYVDQELCFAVKRGGFMYGTVNEQGEVAVHFIYEPPQKGGEDELLLLRDDEEEKRVEAIATGLGMKRVGFIFSESVIQSNRKEKDYIFSAAEIRQAAELQAESELKEWVTALVKLDGSGSGNVHFEAFQLSDVCLKLFKNGWFAESKNVDPKITRMTEDVVVLGKHARDVDNHLFLVAAKVLDHEGLLSFGFPVENRGEKAEVDVQRALRTHMDKTMHVPYVRRLSDFHLLLLLSRFLDVDVDVPLLANCVKERSAVPEGYEIILESLLAG